MTKRKSTKAEVDHRVRRVAKLLTQGATRSDILQYTANEWGMKTRHSDQYIQDARKLLEKDFDIDRKQFTAEILSQLASLQKQARNDKNLNVALGYINSMAKVGKIFGT